eukprot:2809198-Amphidinium_carterae.1
MASSSILVGTCRTRRVRSEKWTKNTQKPEIEWTFEKARMFRNVKLRGRDLAGVVIANQGSEERQTLQSNGILLTGNSDSESHGAGSRSYSPDVGYWTFHDVHYA